jgi:hypothetical protein
MMMKKMKRSWRIDEVATTIDSGSDAFPACVLRPDVRAYAVTGAVVAFLLTVFTIILPAA